MIGHFQLGSATVAAVVLSLVSASQDKTPEKTKDLNEAVNTQAAQTGSPHQV